MDILSSLRTDHALIRDTLNRLTFEGTGPTAEDDWTVLFHDLKIAVVAHNRAEETYVYTVLHELPGHAELAKLKTHEHHLAEELLEALEEIDPADNEWEERLAVFRNALLGHIEEEEVMIFPMIEKVLDDARSQQMAEDFEAMNEEIRLGVPYHPKGRSPLNPAGLDLTR